MPLPVLNVAQMRAWETATWAAGQTEAEVIERVGRKLAGRILALTRDNDLILVLAGKGHNGDDARAALPHLVSRRTDCLNVRDPASQLPELQQLLARKPALVVDALFGIGLNRALDEHWIRFIATLNTARLEVLSVDTPSGLDADSGRSHGAAVHAALTLTVGAPKTGLLSEAAWPYVGRLEVAHDVGLIPCPTTDTGLIWSAAEDFASFPPSRPVASHKGSFGHLAIVAGSQGFHGAAVLATRAAQRAQPGLVTVHTLPECFVPVASQLQGAMVRPWSAEGESLAKHSAILVGPGLAAREAKHALAALVQKLWTQSPIPMVVDASALDWLEAAGVPQGAIRVLTPHPGEAARLLATTSEQVQADRPQALRELSKRFGHCWVVLKGHQTLVGRSTGSIAVNSSGNPKLAQGGSGDILAGYIAGLLAQPGLQKDVAQTLRYAVWQHGAAADQLTAYRPNWVVEELAAEIGNAH